MHRAAAIHAVPGRACGTCSLCCVLPDIDALAKPANEWCVHCRPGRGCGIYAERPALCAAFLCTWMSDPALGEEWQPTRSRMMIYRQGPQVTVLVEPDCPDAWKQEPYFSQLQQWAADIEQDGGFMIVFVGDEAIKIEPSTGEAAIDDRWLQSTG